MSLKVVLIFGLLAVILCANTSEARKSRKYYKHYVVAKNKMPEDEIKKIKGFIKSYRTYYKTFYAFKVGPEHQVAMEQYLRGRGILIIL